jgi:putative FmdB family regulatory protein
MPLYEYLCDACGHRFEKIQKFSDPLIEECPNCGEKQVHKLVSSPAIQFKGTGWYITDYAKKNTVDAAKAAADSGNGDGKASDAKSADSKPGDAQTKESKSGATKPGDSHAKESKSGDSKSTESKSSDSKSSESKSSESKSSDTKSSDSKTTTAS